MRSKIPMVIAAAASLLALTAGTALAAGTLDTQSTNRDGTYPVGVNHLAQTFTPTQTGHMDAVDVYTEFAQVIGVRPAIGPWTATITTTSGGLPTATVLATETFAPADSGWVNIPLTVPPAVVAGTQYALVVAPDTTGTWDGYCFSDAYGPGVAYVLDGASWLNVHAYATAHSLGASYCEYDLAFRTYVAADPAPTPTLAPSATPAPSSTPPPTSTTGAATDNGSGSAGMLLLFAGIASAAFVSLAIAKRRVTAER